MNHNSLHKEINGTSFFGHRLFNFPEIQPVNLLIITFFVFGLRIGDLSSFVFWLAVVLLVDHKRIVSTASIILFVFLIYYFATDYYHGGRPVAKLITLSFYYFCAYQLGAASSIFSPKKAFSNKKLFYLMYAFFAGYLVYLSINLFFYDQNNLKSVFYFKWFPGAHLRLPVTQLTYFLTPIIVLPPIIFYYYRNLVDTKKLSFFELSLLFVVIGVASFISVEIGRRAPIAMFLVVFVYYMLKALWRIISANEGNRLFSTVFLLLVLVLVSWLLVSTPVFERLINIEIANYPRLSLWYGGVLSLLQYPFGGCGDCLMNEYKLGHIWAHNMWLDVGRVGGVISMILLLLFQVLHIKYVWQIANCSVITDFMKSSILVLILVLFMNYLIEPVFQAIYANVAYGFFFLGLLKNLALSIPKYEKVI